MNETTTSSIPVSIEIGGKKVFSGHIFAEEIRDVLRVLTAVTTYVSKSYPLTPEQATQLVRKIDTKTGDFLKALAANHGELTFGEMQRIFGIKDWNEYSSRFGKGLTRALRHLTGNSTAALVWWDDDEWAADNDPNGPVYLDGAALKSLRLAFEM